MKVSQSLLAAFSDGDRRNSIRWFGLKRLQMRISVGRSRILLMVKARRVLGRL